MTDDGSNHCHIDRIRILGRYDLPGDDAQSEHGPGRAGFEEHALILGLCAAFFH